MKFLLLPLSITGAVIAAVECLKVFILTGGELNTWPFLAKTCIGNIFKLACFRLDYGSDCVDKWNIFQLYINRWNQFMSQRPSTSGALSCHPWQGQGFLSKRNHPPLAALLSSTCFLRKWVWPLEIFVMALQHICVQTSSGPHLTYKVISYGYSAYNSPAKALPCCSSSTLSWGWPSRLTCQLYPWHLVAT